MQTSSPGRVGFAREKPLAGAEVALRRLGGDLSAAEQAFYEGKVASARWFARTVLPKLAAEVQIAEATDLAVMDLPEAAF